jgi:hypothetical protein
VEPLAPQAAGSKFGGFFGAEQIETQSRQVAKVGRKANRANRLRRGRGSSLRPREKTGSKKPHSSIQVATNRHKKRKTIPLRIDPSIEQEGREEREVTTRFPRPSRGLPV